jgi:hypothetical protein
MGFLFLIVFMFMGIVLTESEKKRILSLYNINEQSSNTSVNQCRDEFDKLFKDAKTWLTNWISSDQFKRKISIGQPNIGINNDSKIKNWLGKIPKIKLYFETPTHNENSFGWYDHSFPEKIFINEKKVNCNNIKNIQDSLKSMMVHEMVHCLEKEIGWIGNSSVTDKIQNVRPELLDKDTEYYLSDRDETVAYIYGTRTFLNLKPNQEITDLMIVNKLNELQKSVEFNISDDRQKFKDKFRSLQKDMNKFPNLNVLLFKFFSSNNNYLNEFLNDVNLLAKNNSKDNTSDLA